jgi:hypothetical protein
MQIFSATQKGPLKMSGYIDPDDTTLITLYWGAALWSPSKVYKIGDVTRPLTNNGYYYQCTTTGVSGSTEPSWGNSEDDTVSGTAVFKAVSWDLWLLYGESVSTSAWTSSNGVSLGLDSISPESTTVMITAIDPSLTEWSITNQISKASGEKLSRSFLYKSNQQ